MHLRLPADQVDALRDALRHAGTNEIGGQLFGELLAASTFRVTEVAVQKRRGTFARFVVDLVQAARDAARFFERTGHSYTRFNYIGEWHSHPSFAIQPSGTDLAAMRALVRDREFRGSFAVLMLTRLDGDHLAWNAWVFDPTSREQAIIAEIEP